MGHDVLTKDALVFLFAAGILVPILRVLKLPTVAGFILGPPHRPQAFVGLVQAVGRAILSRWVDRGRWRRSPPTVPSFTWLRSNSH